MSIINPYSFIQVSSVADWKTGAFDGTVAVTLNGETRVVDAFKHKTTGIITATNLFAKIPDGLISAWNAEVTLFPTGKEEVRLHIENCVKKKSPDEVIIWFPELDVNTKNKNYGVIPEKPTSKAKIKGDACLYEVWGIDWIHKSVLINRAGGLLWLPIGKVQFVDLINEQEKSQ